MTFQGSEHDQGAKGPQDDAQVVVLFPNGPVREVPAKVVTPAERGLSFVVSALVQQLGWHGAYNRLIDAALTVKPKQTRVRTDSE